MYILLHLLTLVFCIFRVLAENIVKFADPELEKTVRETLGIFKSQVIKIKDIKKNRINSEVVL